MLLSVSRKHISTSICDNTVIDFHLSNYILYKFDNNLFIDVRNNKILKVLKDSFLVLL